MQDPKKVKEMQDKMESRLKEGEKELAEYEKKEAAALKAAEEAEKKEKAEKEGDDDDAKPAAAEK